jgi:hypothetical protein
MPFNHALLLIATFAYFVDFSHSLGVYLADLPCFVCFSLQPNEEKKKKKKKRRNFWPKRTRVV